MARSKYLFIFICLLDAVASGQQTNTPVKLSHYILDTFSRGKVQVNTGVTYEQLLNYNTLTGEMMFNDGGHLLAFAKPEDVDTVFIQGRKFIPVDHEFYEVLTNTAAPLLQQFTYKIEDHGAPVGIGNSTPATNVTSYSSMLSTSAAYAIKLPDNYTVLPGFAYWIRKDNKYKKVSTAKQLISIFPDKKEVINEFIKNNHTKFSESKDLVLLVQQIEQ